jgi:hypothetical protein
MRHPFIKSGEKRPQTIFENIGNIFKLDNNALQKNNSNSPKKSTRKKTSNKISHRSSNKNAKKMNTMWLRAIRSAIHTFENEKSHTRHIHEKDELTKMIKYFKFMEKLYNFIHITSFYDLSNKFVNVALVIYLLTYSKNIEPTENDAYKLLELIMVLKPIYGGVDKEILTEIIERLDIYLESDLRVLNQLYKDEINDIDTNEIENIYNTILRFTNENKENLNLIVKKTEFKRDVNDLQFKYNIFKNFDRTKRTYPLKKYELLDIMKKIIFSDIFIPVKILLERKGITKESGDAGNLTNVQRELAQNVLVTIATGGIYHIFNKNDSREPLNTNNSLLQSQYGIIQKIIKDHKVTDSIDNKIRDAFITYVKRINTQNQKPTYDDLNSIGKIIDVKRKQKNNIQVINNASPKDALTVLGIDFATIKHVCPISSLIDPMGSLGSCFKPGVKKEKNVLSFSMNGPDTSVMNGYYEGQFIVDKTNPKFVRIVFDSGINGFYVHSQIDVDITTDKIVTLSVSNTYKRIIHRILDIWQRLYDNRKISPENMWSALQGKDIYAEIISTTSSKGIGDFYQEVNSVAENGGYVDSNVVNNTDFRIGAMGDQPSGVRAGYFLLRGNKGIHENALAGYLRHDSIPIMVIRDQTNRYPVAQFDEKTGKSLR